MLRKRVRGHPLLRVFTRARKVAAPQKSVGERAVGDEEKGRVLRLLSKGQEFFSQRARFCQRATDFMEFPQAAEDGKQESGVARLLGKGERSSIHIANLRCGGLRLDKVGVL